MIIAKLGEAGWDFARLGLSLSYERAAETLGERMGKLAPLGGGHNKFLESIIVWLDITGPRYWWQQMDTYRIGVTKQSGSTMHTLTRRPLEQTDFAEPIDTGYLLLLNLMIRHKEFRALKNALPEGYLQRRIVCTNYMTLQNIIRQRKTHRLMEWQTFCELVSAQVDHPEYLE